MRTTLISIVALLSGTVILLFGGGLQGILVPVRATMEGFSTLSLGLLGTLYSVGFIAGCLTVPIMVRRVGHIRTFGVLAALSAMTILVFGLAVSPWIWLPLRVVTGFCFAGTAMVIESWLNERADNKSRGTLFAVYMLCNLAAMTVGQLTLALGDPMDAALFMIVAIAFAAALVPTALSVAPAPTPPARVRIRLAWLYGISPVGTVTVLLVGFANGAFSTLGAVYAQRVGLGLTDVALFVSAVVIGGAAAQIPAGRLSDRMDRRRVIMISAGLAAILALLLMRFGAVGGPLTLALAALFGMGLYPLYGLAVAHTNDHAEPEDFVDSASGLLMLWGIGAMLGPLPAVWAMGAMGPGGLFAALAAFMGAIIAFTAWRMTRRAAVPVAAKSDFVSIPAALTPEAASTLDPRGVEAEQAMAEAADGGTPAASPAAPGTEAPMPEGPAEEAASALDDPAADGGTSPPLDDPEATGSSTGEAAPEGDADGKPTEEGRRDP